MGVFKAQGKILKFDGYRQVLPPGGKQEDALLPPLSEKQELDLLDLTASQHFTAAAAALQRGVAGQGAGEGRHRPAQHLRHDHQQDHQKRGYVEQKERRFFATEIGKMVTDLLVEHFPKVMDLKFTSAHGGGARRDRDEARRATTTCWTSSGARSREALEKAETKMPSSAAHETGEMCPQCGKPLVEQYSSKTRRQVRRLLGLQGEPASTSSRARARPSGRSRSRPSTSARPAASRCCSAWAAAARSWAAAATPSARRR